ncbi:hypothetical protein ACH5RR_006688 [Cinchona calisaya]|uniref:Transposase-associated domain-containing protein n=1 Tax=Cinchona calisaya TaxID=153742 RepID=A0ABD3APP3_9GENT
MDRSWMHIADHHSRDYLKGVNDFIEFAKQNMGDESTIPCPCKKCMISSPGTLHEVKSHLKHPGIDKSYTFSVHHGECLDDDDDIDDDLGKDVAVDNIDEDNNDDVHQMLDDIQRSTFIETGHGGSESTLKIDKTKEDNLARFDKLLKDAERELYPGCKLSLLSSLLKLLHVKVLNKWSNKSWNLLVEVLKEILPEGERLPNNYYEAGKVLGDIGLGCACKNDCVLFWNEHENRKECPECLESRWKVNDGKGKQIPHKILRYCPLKPRLQRLYMSKQTASDMKWHKEKPIEEENTMRHPSDSEAWKHLDKQFLRFAEDPRNVRLGLATDGFNPFGNMNNSYSTWPIIVMPYNLPPWLCMKDEYFMMSLLIPRPRVPGKEIDSYL